MKIKLLVVFILLVANFTVLAQYKTIIKIVNADNIPQNLSEESEKYLNNIVVYFQQASYLRALPFVDSLCAKNPDNTYFKYFKAIAYSYSNNLVEQSEKLFEELALQKDSLEDFDLFYANMLWNKGEFKKSTEFFKKALASNLSIEAYKEFALIRILQYDNLLEQEKYKQLVAIKNIGLPVNSEDSEYAPVINASGTKLYFTYRGVNSEGGKQLTPGQKDEEKGTYFEDIYYAEKINDTLWDKPKPIKELNTIYHEALLSVSQDEKQMFLYRNTSGGTGDIFISRNINGKWSTPEKLKGEVNTSSWEGSAFLSPDGKYLYFASERPGGYGGKDLYRAKLIDGKWKKIENLGPQINTKADEDSPVLFGDGNILFFSSNGHKSIGGFDIFRSDNINGKWSEPINVGAPVNTPKDDIFFTITADGSVACLSSDRKGSIGRQDIYEIQPGLIGKPAKLVVLKGIVRYNFNPVESKILIRSELNTMVNYEPIFSNTKGEYTVALPAQDNFKIDFTYLDKISITKNISTEMIDTISALFLDVDLLDNETEQTYALTEEKISILKSEFEEFDLKDPLTVMHLKDSLNNLYFSIQVGAFKEEKNFDHAKFINLPRIRREYNSSDKIVRFYLGNYSTIEKTFEDYLNIKNRYIDDAFIVAFYNNEKISLKSALQLLSNSEK